MKKNAIVIGTRGSQLALWQAEWVKKEMLGLHPGLKVELEIIKTTGDKILDSPLSMIGDKGLFTKEIENALLAKRIDLAVHSLKDLPTNLPPGLILGAVPKREDVRDVFISHPAKKYGKLDDVPPGGKIATGSLRRRCQLLGFKPGLEIVELRGNLNTRFEKLASSDWDGMILARAGVVRLGFSDRITEVIPAERILPAVGQGALGIEIRSEDSDLLRLLKPLCSKAATYSVLAERAFLRRLEGGCQVPIGAYARIIENMLYIDGLIGSLDGRKIVRGSSHGDPLASETLGTGLAGSLSAGGGKEILAEIKNYHPVRP